MNKKIILFVITLGVFIEIADISICNTALYTISSSLHFPLSKAYICIFSYLITLGIVTPLSIWFSSSLGIRRTLSIGFTLFFIGTMLCASAHNLLQLSIYRILQAFGASFMLPVARITLRKYFKENLLLISANLALFFLTAFCFAPVIAGFILNYLSWRWIFIFNTLPLLCCLCLCLMFFPRSEITKLKFDIYGYSLYACFVLCFALLSLIHNPFYFLSLILFGFFIGKAYYHYSQKQALAIIPYKLFCNYRYVFLCLASFCFRTGVYGVVFILPIYLQKGQGYTALQAGLLMGAYGLGAICGRALLNIICPRLSLLSIGLFIYTIIIGALGFVFHKHFFIIAYLIGLGGLSSIQASLFNTQALLAVGDEMTSPAAVFYSSILQIAGSFGIAFISLFAFRQVNLLTVALVFSGCFFLMSMIVTLTLKIKNA